MTTSLLIASMLSPSQAKMAPRTKPFHIPTINIAPYLRDSTSDAGKKVVQDVRNACMTVGFFSLIGHGIPRDIQENVLKASKRLFDLPLEEKMALRHPVLKNRGYEIIGAQALQSHTLPDLKEVYQPLLTHSSGLHTEADFDQGLLRGQAYARRL